MRALIVDTEPGRVEAVQQLFEAAGTTTEILSDWNEASPRLTSSARPDIVVVAFNKLVEDGLNSFLGADAQLKVLRIPAFLLHSAEEAGEVDAVRPLANFKDSIEMPREGDSMAKRLNQVIPDIAYEEISPGSSSAGIDFDGFDWDDPALLAPGTLVDGRYEIESFVAAGGMGHIYRALQQPLGRPVALKVIRGELSQDRDAIARFRLEAQTVSRLSHPHTIVLFDYGIDGNGQMYLAMEWLEGDTLDDRLDAGKIFDPLAVARIGKQVAESLNEAHRKGIVHRDLKPGNIFLCNDQATPDFAKVLDFGIAKLVDGSMTSGGITRIGTICGTPEYMSPEQARGEDLDGRSDIYALGCCLHAMMTGEAPFMDDQPLQVIMKHQTDPMPRLGAHVPRSLVEVLDKCTAKLVDDRYTDALELAKVLEGVIERIEQGDTASAAAPAVPATPIVPASQAHVDPNERTALPSENPFAGKRGSSRVRRGHTVQLEVPTLREGVLTGMSLARVMHLLAMRNRTGTLRVKHHNQERTLTMVRGRVLRSSLDGFLPSFARTDGHWMFEVGGARTGDMVEPLHAIYEGIRLHASVNSLAKQLSQSNQKYPARTTLYEQDRMAWDSSGRAAEVFALCDGQKTLSQVMSSGVDFAEVARALVLGRDTDALIFADAPCEAPVPASYQVDKEAADALSEADTRLLGMLEEQIDSLLLEEHYDALGLLEGCGEGAVRDAFNGIVANLPERTHEAEAIQLKARELEQLLRSVRDQLIERERVPAPITAKQRRVLNELEKQRVRFSGDPHDAFELPRGCGRNAVEDKFFELVNQHHPDHYAIHGRREITEVADEVFIELQKVYQTLLSTEVEKPSGAQSAVRAQSASTQKSAPSTQHHQIDRPKSSSVRRASRPSRPNDPPVAPVSSGFARSARSSTKVNESGNATRVKVKLPKRSATTTRASTPRPTATSSGDFGRSTTERRAAPAAPRARTDRVAAPRPRTRNTPSPSSKSAAEPRVERLGNRRRKMSDILQERAVAIEASRPQPEKPEETQPTESERPRTTRTKRPDLSALRGARTPGEHYRTGKRYLQQNNLESAREAFAAAVEMAPDNGSYGAHLAWTDYLCDPSTLDSVMARLLEYRKQTNGVEATYFLAKISFQNGELSKAKRLYEKVLMDNETHVEAKRELRLLRQRVNETNKKSTGFFNRVVKKFKS